MNCIYNESNRDELPPSLERLLSNIDLNESEPKNQTIYDILYRYLCCFSLINSRNVI